MQNNVCVLDTNAILRYLLEDIQEQYEAVRKKVQSKNCSATLEVIAEVCYVLDGIYGLSRTQIIDALKKLCADINVENDDVLLRAFEIFDKPPKLDFVDCLLYGYNVARGVDILTFDKKLNTVLKG